MPSMWTVCTDPYFRMATYVVFGLCLGNTLTGINGINEFSSRIFEDIRRDNPGHGLKPVVGNTLCGGVQVFACLIAPLLANFNLRAVLVAGFIAMGIFEVLLGTFITLKMNNAVLGCLVISLFIYQICLGTYTWVYIAQVGNEKNQALGSLVLWGVVQSLVINYMFDYMGENGTFWLYGGCSIVAGIVMWIYMKETKGLTQE